MGGRTGEPTGGSAAQAQGDLYGGQSNAFCTVPLGGTMEQSEMGHTLTSLHEESAETDCLLPSYSPTSSIVLVPSRPRSDPSTDCQYVTCRHSWSLFLLPPPFLVSPAHSCFCCISSCFEFGTVHIPLKARHVDKSVEELVRSFDQFSLELFSRNRTPLSHPSTFIHVFLSLSYKLLHAVRSLYTILECADQFLDAVGDQGKPAQLQYVEVIAKDDSTLSNYHALLDELLCVLLNFHLNPPRLKLISQ